MEAKYSRNIFSCWLNVKIALNYSKKECVNRIMFILFEHKADSGLFFKMVIS